ncbi:MAG: GTPase ObgE [Oscillospiraceae bacterium]|nr:GTPase ObgE [Oscillospiraceae bacterium]
MFVDQAKIHIEAGRGGDGAVSFHREKYVAAGGPDGGDGGKGGDVIFVADDHFSSLISFRYQRKYVAENGQPGAAKRCTGKSAPDLVIKVPRGTVVREAQSGRIMADISGDEPVILAKGGRGGKGNQHFASSTRQVPRFAKPGYDGEKFDVILELKLLADVGLAGFPNVGKSTLISVVSAAKPKIANYHFTTLEPVLGVVKLDDERSFVMADIPGLIEGAAGGAGLGHSFLRHVERCRLIVHVLDVSGCEDRDPIEDFEKINKELAEFSEDLSKCPQIVAANKADIASEEQIERLHAYIASKELPFYVISAASAQGTKPLLDEIAATLATLPPVKRFEAEAAPEPLPEEKKKFTIEIDQNGTYQVDAPFMEPIMRTVNPDDWSSLQYFERVLISSGIIAKLEEMGAKEGVTVSINGFEFDYVD